MYSLFHVMANQDICVNPTSPKITFTKIKIVNTEFEFILQLKFLFYVKTLIATVMNWVNVSNQ